MKQIIAILALLVVFSSTASAQWLKKGQKYEDPIYDYPGRPQWVKVKKTKAARPFYLNPQMLKAGVSTIGAGLATIGIGNAAIATKMAGETDSDAIERLNKSQKIINYVGGGLGVTGAILTLFSIKKCKTTDKGYPITERLHIKDKNGEVSLTYEF